MFECLVLGFREYSQPHLLAQSKIMGGVYFSRSLTLAGRPRFRINGNPDLRFTFGNVRVCDEMPIFYWLPVLKVSRKRFRAQPGLG
jgi:hypothetical protein